MAGEKTSGRNQAGRETCAKGGVDMKVYTKPSVNKVTITTVLKADH